MKTYYDEAGKPLGRAWSTMLCRKARNGEDHPPHSHHPEYAMYGPYMCEGYPGVLIYDLPPRKPVNQ